MKNILVIDDDPDTRDLLAVMLSREGWAVRTAPDRDDAVKMIWSKIPHVILLDYEVPGMSPAEFMQKVNAITPIPKVILMTAHFRVIEKAKELNIARSLAKPFTDNDVRSVIAQCLEPNGDHDKNCLA